MTKINYWLLLSLVFIYKNNNLYAKVNSVENDSITLQIANSFLNTNPDRSLILYKDILTKLEGLKKYKKEIKCHIGLSDIYKNKNQYGKSYNSLWDALLIAEKIKDTLSLVVINRDLGRLYNIYEKHKKALFHFNTSVSLLKRKDLKNKTIQHYLSNNYYSLAITYRKTKKYQKALSYLDSCTYSETTHTNKLLKDSAYVTLQKGYVYLKMDRLKKAKFYLENGHKLLDKQNKNYRIISALYLGDLHVKEQKWQQAKNYYNYSLQVLENNISHKDKKIELLKKLAFVLKRIGKINKAYHYLENSISISDSLFNTKTTINNELFQINNKYEATIREKNDFIRNQKNIIDKNKNIQFRLKLIIGFIFFAVSSIAIFFFMRFKLKRLRIEQQQQKLKNIYEQDKTKEIMEVKSRELTANTLQLIEKDHNIKELLEELKHTAPDRHKKLKSRILNGSKNMWEEFNKRFIEVNSKFYDNLRQIHPNLTPTEQKHCALIKLNFDSKEMASILNISLNSVHISRHRIRKKIGLERDDNLSNYIADI